jgi:hypothetical protein
MSPRNEVFQAIHFDASSDIKEPLIATGDAEEEENRLEWKALSRIKFSLGIVCGFLLSVFHLGSNFFAHYSYHLGRRCCHQV